MVRLPYMSCPFQVDAANFSLVPRLLPSFLSRQKAGEEPGNEASEHHIQASGHNAS